MTTVFGVTTFDAAGVTFCEIPEGDAMIGDTELGQTPKFHHIRKFALAQKSATNLQINHYAERMGDFTCGRVAVRKNDGRPFVVERTRADGTGSQSGAGIIAFDESSSILVGGGVLVNLVPNPNRYVLGILNAARRALFDKPNLPAALVTGLQALGWADFLARESGRDVTLPTDIQWQYAAQGGQGHRYAPHGRLDPNEVVYNPDLNRDGTGALDREGWEKLLNPFGLLDMTGNVDEYALIDELTSLEALPWIELVGQNAWQTFAMRQFGANWRESSVRGLLVSSYRQSGLIVGYNSNGLPRSATLGDGVRVALAQAT